MKTPQLNATGQRGSWYAMVDGVEYPCVHQANMQKDRTYRASNVSDPAHEKLLAKIIECGRVVVRKSVFDDAGDTWSAKGYLALFSVSDAKIENDTLTFRFIERLANLNR